MCSSDLKVLEHRDREDALSILVESPAVEGDAATAPVDTVGNLDTLDVAGVSDLDGNPWALLERYIELLEHNVAHRDLTAIYTATAVSVLDAEHPAHRWMANHLNAAVERYTKCGRLLLNFENIKEKKWLNRMLG